MYIVQLVKFIFFPARAELPGPEINIGVDVKYPRPSRSEALATSLQARRDKEKERAARLLQCMYYPFTRQLSNLNFHQLEVVPRYRDPQP